MFPTTVDFPFCFGDTHKEFGVFDGNPAREDFHDVFEVGIEDDITHAINQGSRRSMQNIETLAECSWIFIIRRDFTLPSGRRGSASVVFGISKKHKDIPHPKLSGEGDRIIKESEVPTGSIGRWRDSNLVLQNWTLAMTLGVSSEFHLRVLWRLHLRLATPVRSQPKLPLDQQSQICITLPGPAAATI